MQSSRTQVTSQTCVVADFYGKSYFDGTRLIEPSSQQTQWTAWACSPACASCDSLSLDIDSQCKHTKDIKLTEHSLWRCFSAKADFETRTAQMKANFASVEARQREQRAKEKPTWGGGGKRMVMLKNTLYEHSKIHRHWALWVQESFAYYLVQSSAAINVE